MNNLRDNIYTDDRILKILGRMKIAFIIFIILGILDISHGILELSKGIKRTHNMEGISAFLVFSLLYIGLRFSKKWFIPLVLYLSAGLLLNAGFFILQPVADIHELYVKIGSMIIFIFSVYQIYFFSRQEVKYYFGSKGKFFF